MDGAPELLIGHKGGVACITLNRPRVLNALSLAMYRELGDVLEKSAANPDVDLVVVRGAGERGFCAGGDLHVVHAACARGDAAFVDDVFRTEYTLNRRIHAYPKPYMALMDGLVMGGGCGISVHGSHRVVTERTRLAMPETAIGFFPDVGSGHFLSRCPGALGTYLALTGTAIGAADAIAGGLADACVPSGLLDKLVDALATGMPAEKAIAEFAVDPGEPSLQRHGEVIERCFSRESVEAVVAALAAEEGAFARETHGRLSAIAPFSLKVTLQAIRSAAAMSVEECLIMDFRVCRRMVWRADFAEGVRALLVEKDGDPKWQPGSLSAVDAAEVGACFASLGAKDLSFG